MAKLELSKELFERIKNDSRSLTKFSEIKFDSNLFDFQKYESTLIISKEFKGEIKLDGQDLLDNSIKNIDLNSTKCMLILVNNMFTQINISYDNIEALTKVRTDETQNFINVFIRFDSLIHTDILQECYLPDLKFTPYNLTLLNLNMNVSSLVLFCFHELFILNRIEIVFEKVSEIHVNSLNYHIVSLIETSCDTKFKVIFNKYSNQGSCLVRIENPKLEKVEFRNSIL